MAEDDARRAALAPPEGSDGSDDAASKLTEGTALCLSGGGSRAMLFHLGALWRLNDANMLSKIERISSVSGGSIIAGVLAQRWKKLGFDAAGHAGDFATQIVDTVRAFGRQTIDVGALGWGVLLPGSSTSDHLIGAFRDHLFGDTTLQELPDSPRFVFNATNLQSGALWRFSKPYVGDYLVGRLDHPAIPLATAVAASSAFPPFFSPVRLDTGKFTWRTSPHDVLTGPEYRDRVLLADGGVYDNLGTETAIKRYRTLLVSDGGGKLKPDPHPHTDWIQQPVRVMSIIDNQVRSLRKRELLDAYQQTPASPGFRKGTYWGIRTNIADYELEKHGSMPPLPAPFTSTFKLAELATRLAEVDDTTQERLINWGYAVCDAGLRRWVDRKLPRPADFPYPASGVG